MWTLRTTSQPDLQDVPSGVVVAQPLCEEPTTLGVWGPFHRREHMPGDLTGSKPAAEVDIGPRGDLSPVA